MTEPLVNYQKRKNTNLFSKFSTNEKFNLTNCQNYVPIYTKFFSLTNSNFNSINLNHSWYITDIKNSKNTDYNDNIYDCKVKHINDESQIVSQKMFVKQAPLLDPFKYFVGKYDYNDPSLFNLPTFDNTVKVHSKINSYNNTAYIDSMFSYLSSMLLNKYKFINGLDFYGSFLGIKNNYKINIADDLDYLIYSEFFIKNKNKLFEVEDYSHLYSDPVDEEPIIKKPIIIHNSSNKSNISIKSIDNNIFEDIFVDNVIDLKEMKDLSIDLVDITNNNTDLASLSNKSSKTLKSGSSCSSRTSHTNSSLNEINNDNDDNDDNDDNNDNNDNHDDDNNNDDNNDNNSEWETEDDISSYEEEEKIYATLKQFPIQVICLEHCENTFDNLILENELTHDEWFSALMQVIMTLITYQKCFSFTHNDLHTNNIMYNETSLKHIYYLYNKKYYKVPTFGRLFKIIDFGRAIYKLDNKLFCSDSFQSGGDASGQYNTEPYFNDKKPRLEPNPSFDLCRLACSIFDFVIEDVSEIKDVNTLEPIQKLILDWCIDDNGINVLYKINGQERYPDFKLYKMIARCVHNHTPQAQLDRPEFASFVIDKKKLPKDAFIINIDLLPIFI